MSLFSKASARAASSAFWLQRVQRHRHQRKLKQPTPFQLQALTAVSVSGLGGLTWLLSGLNFAKEQHEAVWFGDRGFLSHERAVSLLPTGMCIGSGILAASLAMSYPRHVKYLAIPNRFHEMLALPLSLLLAFRFHLSYDRWWKSRNNISELMSRVVVVAEYIVANVPPKDLKDLEPEKVEAQIEAEKIRARSLAILEAYTVFVEERIHGLDFLPHPGNQVDAWQGSQETLKDWPDDAAACFSSKDRIAWCSTALLSAIQQLQELEIIDGDNGSMVGMSVMQWDQILSECLVVKEQKTPAPWIVHYRTIMMMFCFTYPFGIINHVRPFLLVPIQAVISFAFLGSEFCSRYMDHPFGSDKDDIPLRKIVLQTQDRLHQIREHHL